MPRLILGIASSGAGRPADAIAALREAHERHGDPYSLAKLGMAFGRAGMRDQALETLTRMNEYDRRRFMPRICFAWVWASLNDRDRALDCLERALLERDPMVLFARVSPWLDCLRSDARFHALLARLPLLPERRTSAY